MTDSKQNINKHVQDVVTQFVDSQTAGQHGVELAAVIGSLETYLIWTLQELPEDSHFKKALIKTLSSLSKS